MIGALLQTAAAQQGDGVRIRSAPYNPPSDIIAVESNLVEVAATVRDPHGKSVGGLAASDFGLLDNGKPQKVSFFEEQDSEEPILTPPSATSESNSEPAAPTPVKSATPRTRFIALFFDDTHSSVAGFERARQAAQKLIARGLKPGDRMGIYTNSGTAEREFTPDAKALLATLATMKRHPAPGVSTGYGACPKLTAYQAYMIATRLDPGAKMVAVADIRTCSPQIPEEEAEMLAQDSGESTWEILRNQSAEVLSDIRLVIRHLAAQQGARILLMSSPGFVTGGMDRQTTAVTEECLRNRVTMNVLDDEGLLAGGIDSPESMGEHAGIRFNWAERTLGLRNQTVTGFFAEVTAATGGTFFHNNNDLATGMQELESAPAASYLLGFAPDRAPDGKFHKLKLVVSKPGNYRVSARSGYIASKAQDRPETAQERIDRVVSSNESLGQFPATVAVSALAQKNGLYRIQINIKIDAKRLGFGSKSGMSLQQLAFVTLLEDAAGNFMEGKQATMDMIVTSAKRSQLEADGIKAVTSFVAPKGSYRVREVIREALRNRFVATDAVVEAR